jgi:hypothetical protein
MKRKSLYLFLLLTLVPFVSGSSGSGCGSYSFNSGSPSPPAPYISFIAFIYGSINQVKLNFSCQNCNYNGYVIEKSLDGIAFTKIADLPPSLIGDYFDTDLELDRTYYYRWYPYNHDGPIIDPITRKVTTTPKTVFLTSSTYKGDLGGLEGADAICQDHANSASLAGTYMAWLSRTPIMYIPSSPRQRFSEKFLPYQLVDGTIVAGGFNYLGGLQNSINIYENGETASGEMRVHTATGKDGEQAYRFWEKVGVYYVFSDETIPSEDRNCNGWLDSTASFSNVFGWADTAGYLSWTQDGSQVASCDESLRLYCFQQ